MIVSVANSKARWIAGALAVVVAIFVSPIVAQDLGSGRGPATRVEGGGPANVARLAADSTLIVHGRVTKREPKWVGRVIYTFYDVAVQETLKGSPRSSVSVAVPGGAIGNVQLIMPQAPDFVPGDELVLFGQAFGDESSSFRPTSTFEGLVPVVRGEGTRGAVAARGRIEDLDKFLREVRELNPRQ